VGDPPTAGSINPAGDVDWFSFSTNAIAIYPPPQVTYVVETALTSTDMDSVITVYASDGTTVLGSNDDAPGLGFASRVEFTAPAGQVYYVKVRHYYGSSGTGDYTVSVTETP
jgi:hypothetical protein